MSSPRKTMGQNSDTCHLADHLAGHLLGGATGVRPRRFHGVSTASPVGAMRMGAVPMARALRAGLAPLQGQAALSGQVGGGVCGTRLPSSYLEPVRDS